MMIAVIGIIAGLLFLVQGYLFQIFWNRAVEVKITFSDDTIQTGGHTFLTTTVENRKWLPLPVLKVKFQCSSTLRFKEDTHSAVSDLYYRNDLFSLMPFRRVIRKHDVTGTHRGYYGIKGIDLVGADLFLTRELLESRPAEAYLYVTPKLYETAELISAVQKISGEIVSSRHLNSDRFAFRSIREYTPFDEMKTVNWKASAKTDELKVNVYAHTCISMAAIYMNLEDERILKQEEQVEKAISIGAYLAAAFLQQGIGISLYANGRDCIHKSLLCIEDNRDRGQIAHLNQMLARIDLQLGTEDFVSCFEERLMKHTGQMSVIISPDQQEGFQELLCRLDQNRPFLWICPCRKAKDAVVRPELRPYVLLQPDEED